MSEQQPRRPPAAEVTGLTILALLAFAGNSLLGRLAFQETAIDPVSYTSLRLLSGAVVLGLLVAARGSGTSAGGAVPRGRRWLSAVALFVYALGFSLAYLVLPAGLGALLLFAAVQVTMLGWSLLQGERFTAWQWLGFAMACGGLVVLLGWPGMMGPGTANATEGAFAMEIDGSTAGPIHRIPPVAGAVLMLLAGVAWGTYSLLSKGVRDPLRCTALNFWHSLPMAVFCSVLWWELAQWDRWGVAYAVMSGAVTSGVGYAIWYRALAGLSANLAAVVQLTVPVLVAVLGWLFLRESPTLIEFGSAVAILGGVGIVIRCRKR